MQSPPPPEIDFNATMSFQAAEPTPEALGRAREEAAIGAPLLESQGFMVSISQRAATPAAPRNGEQHVVQVIEDDPDLAQLLIDIFMTQGYEVRWATTKMEINAALRRGGEVDLVLLDRELPEADGLSILQQIRAHPRLATLPVIMVTGHAGPIQVAEGLVAGANGYVSKPFKPSGLLQAARAVLGLPDPVTSA